MADETAAATTTLVWALRDYAKVTGCPEATEAAFFLALGGFDDPSFRRAFAAIPTPEVTE